mmetsp:Transcript_77639/g.122523  ORF Transcript_77639/g.122523 Transcript_77639/m.122523 type:complete len:218 (+) Transcript_77639:298-951(+)
MAIHTTLTALGTRTLKAPKCSEARRKPKALDFMAVSMATVRQVFSSKPEALVALKPSKPPTRCNAAQANCKGSPADWMGSAHLATEAPTRRTVEITPTTGVKGETALQSLGARVLSPTPKKMGNSTTWKVDHTIPAASTGTTAPSTKWQIKGVMKMHPRVVDVVMSTLRATSPPAIKVQRFDACPPLMDPTSTRPARIGPSAPMAFANTYANRGVMT